MTCSKSGPQRDPTSHMSGDERKDCHPRRPEEVSTSNQHQSQHPASSHHLLPYHSSHVCKFLCVSPFYWLHDLHVYLIYSSMIIYLSLGFKQVLFKHIQTFKPCKFPILPIHFPLFVHCAMHLSLAAIMAHIIPSASSTWLTCVTAAAGGWGWLGDLGAG